MQKISALADTQQQNPKESQELYQSNQYQYGYEGTEDSVEDLNALKEKYLLKKEYNQEDPQFHQNNQETYRYMQKIKEQNPMDDENELSLLRNKKGITNDYKCDNLDKNVYMIPEDDEEERLQIQKQKNYGIADQNNFEMRSYSAIESVDKKNYYDPPSEFLKESDYNQISNLYTHETASQDYLIQERNRILFEHEEEEEQKNEEIKQNSQNQQHFTLNQQKTDKKASQQSLHSRSIEDKQETDYEDQQVQTAHFNKQANNLQQVHDQHVNVTGFEAQQVGKMYQLNVIKETGPLLDQRHIWEMHDEYQKDYNLDESQASRQAKLQQIKNMLPGPRDSHQIINLAENHDSSPKMKQFGEQDKINQLLNQLQAPLNSFGEMPMDFNIINQPNMNFLGYDQFDNYKQNSDSVPIINLAESNRNNQFQQKQLPEQVHEQQYSQQRFIQNYPESQYIQNNMSYQNLPQKRGDYEVLQGNSYQNYIPEQVQNQQKRLSLAERANQAKLAQRAQTLPQNLLQQQINIDQNKYYAADSSYSQNQGFDSSQIYRQDFDQNFKGKTFDYNYNQLNFQQQPSIKSHAPPQQQQLPYQGQNVDFSKTDKNEKVANRKKLLAQFDDIPIHQLHKAEGYQVRNIDEEYQQEEQRLKKALTRDASADDLNVEADNNQDQDVNKMPLTERVSHPKWKVRMQAFKEIGSLLESYRGQKKTLSKEEQMYGDPSNPFELYGPLIENMIKDSNITAQLEGLNCLHSFVKLGQDIKSVSFACHSYLLDKIQHNKPQLRDVTMRIFQQIMIKKQIIVPEILKRFKIKGSKSIQFCLDILNVAFKEKNLKPQDANLKQVYKNTHELLAHQTKEIREAALELMSVVFENCEDSVDTFCNNLTALRPLQLKEVKETLEMLHKDYSNPNLIKIFDSQSTQIDRKDGQQISEVRPRANLDPTYDEKQAAIRDKSKEPEGGYNRGDEIDLINLLPENFNEIAYINQINQKRKAMEQLNQELEKICALQNQERIEGSNVTIVKTKDYSVILNVTTHILEDPNMLVFIEGIKTVEYLSMLISSQLKGPKIKTFISLLADKYKETKTAVLAALEKTFEALFKNKILSPASFFDILINSIAATHKNPRVKQMVLDRSEILLDQFYLDQAQLPADVATRSPYDLVKESSLIFKQVKDKLKQIILKDTSASVRDSAIGCLGLFRMLAWLSEKFSRVDETQYLSLIKELINSLPKQRQQEIQKRLEAFQDSYIGQEGMQDLRDGKITEGDDYADEHPRSKSGANRPIVKQKPGKSQERGRSAKREDDVNDKQKSPKGPQQNPNIFQTQRAQKNVNQKFQASLSDVILTIKNISQNQDRLRSSQIVQNLDNALEDLSEGNGIRECKPHIVTCIYWLLTNYSNKVNFLEGERQEALHALLGFIKKIYCYDRYVSESNENCQELNQVITILLYSYALLQSGTHGEPGQGHQVVSQLLFIMIVACQESPNISIKQLVETLFSQFTKLDPCPKQVKNGRALIISYTLYFLADRIGEIIQRSQQNVSKLEKLNQSLILTDFDSFVSLAMKETSTKEGSLFNSSQDQKELVLQSVVYFKDKISQWKRSNEGEQRTSNEKTAQFRIQDENPSEQYYLGHIEVVELLNTNFEKGLLKLKQLVAGEAKALDGKGGPTMPFENKEIIFQALLKLTNQAQTTQADQYRQAYSLKALMWLREEFIGLEETFRLIHHLMDQYVIAQINRKDSSIEMYILNNWAEGLSLRDLSDRIHFSHKVTLQQPDQNFIILFKWLMENRLKELEKDNKKWNLDDFRKIAPLIASQLVMANQKVKLSALGDTTNQDKEQLLLEFLDLCEDKFGAERVRDFMEIQLLHHNDILIKFLDLFNEKYYNKLNPKQKQAYISALETDSRESLGEPLITNRTDDNQNILLNLPNNRDLNGNNIVTDRSVLLQERRNKIKEKNILQDSEAEFQATLELEKQRYDEIMSKLDQLKVQRAAVLEGKVTEERSNTNFQSLPSQNLSVEQKRQVVTSKGREPDTQRLGSRGYQSTQDFNDSQDFKLSTDQQNSMAILHPAQSVRSSARDFDLAGHKHIQSSYSIGDGIKMQNIQKKFMTFESTDSLDQSDIQTGQQIIRKNENSFIGENSSAQILQESRLKIKNSMLTQEEKLQRLESSNMKVRQVKDEVQQLQQERKRLEMEKAQLLSEQNKESEEWRHRFEQLMAKNGQVAKSLNEANQCYLEQVSENERLSEQLREIQQEHQQFLQKYLSLEQQLKASNQKIEEQQQQLLSRSSNRMTSDSFLLPSDQVVDENQLQQISKAFNPSTLQVANLNEDEVSIKKIQELLLDSEGQMNKNLSKCLIVHYQQLKHKNTRMTMLQALKVSLEHEDVLYAISIHTYKNLLDFLLRAFSYEKELIERDSYQGDFEREAQNELTQESQRLVSKLLNSKEFTISLICLIQLLKSEAIPSDISLDLSIQERQYMRVMMRCISRISKALHSENPELIRAFDVLIEMHRLFIKHPPENLRQDLPCLQDFDFVYRGLKEVSDKLIELQPEKCISFLKFCQGQEEFQLAKQNAFLKYISQMVERN